MGIKDMNCNQYEQSNNKKIYPLNQSTQSEPIEHRTKGSILYIT